jgi:hypothetical protein
MPNILSSKDSHSPHSFHSFALMDYGVLPNVVKGPSAAARQVTVATMLQCAMLPISKFCGVAVWFRGLLNLNIRKKTCFNIRKFRKTWFIRFRSSWFEHVWTFEKNVTDDCPMSWFGVSSWPMVWSSQDTLSPYQSPEHRDPHARRRSLDEGETWRMFG